MLADINMLQIFYLVAIFVGVMLVSLGPFLRKNPGPWDSRYTILIVVSYIVAVVASFILLSFNPLTVEDPALIIAAGFVVGLGSKPLLEEIWKNIDPDWWSKE